VTSAAPLPSTIRVRTTAPISSPAPVDPARQGRDRPDVPHRDARTVLLDTAERHLAERGLHGTSLRQLCEVASYNRSAVWYHFGTREGLVEALVNRRRTDIESRRTAMLDDARLAGRGRELRALVEIIVVPLVHVLAESSWYYRVLVQLAASSSDGAVLVVEPPRDSDLFHDTVAAVNTTRPHVLAQRLRSSSMTTLFELAWWERRAALGATVDRVFVASSLIDIVVAVLTAADTSPGALPPRLVGAPAG
jgi:AcrR family transcriptional regulator